jgi:hypothetical protein
MMRVRAVILAAALGATGVAAGAEMFTVGAASSMELVRPRSGVSVAPAKEVSVRLARDEYESVQILVAAAANLTNVQVVIDMGRSGFAASNVSAAVVGYVQTTNVPPYKVRPKRRAPATGWWPDPILDFQRSADVARGDVQSFWVRVHCPVGQRAGTYRGSLSVSADGQPTLRLPFSVRVNDFTVSRTAPLPLIISCDRPGVNAKALPKEGRKARVERIRASDYHHAWETREEMYCDFFSDYYISWGAPLYLNAKQEPNWRMLKRLKDRGRLGFFNLCYWWYMGSAADAEEKWCRKTLPVFRARYEKAKALGLAERAVLYGCDEQDPPTFTNIARTVDAIHRHLPGLPVMTTARDGSFGTSSVLTNVDIFCPVISRHKGPQLAQARAAGRKVWWYICCDPPCPWPNAFIECPPVELRSIMGAMTQKFKPDGFLYYATLIWNSDRPIEKGPFTDWEPRSYGNFHGDGQWACCGGPDLLPLATIRLENFRDGLEDLWYARILEKRLNARVARRGSAADGDGWCRRARAALAVPQQVVKWMSNFSYDPAVLSAWRDEMADLIEESGVPSP